MLTAMDSALAIGLRPRGGACPSPLPPRSLLSLVVGACRRCSWRGKRRLFGRGFRDLERSRYFSAAPSRSPQFVSSFSCNPSSWKCLPGPTWMAALDRARVILFLLGFVPRKGMRIRRRATPDGGTTLPRKSKSWFLPLTAKRGASRMPKLQEP